MPKIDSLDVETLAAHMCDLEDGADVYVIISALYDKFNIDLDDYPQGDNDHWLEMIAAKCQDIVFCWGVFKQARLRAEDVKKRFPGAYCLKKTKEGHPWHPLYVAGKTKPIPF
jgi:hypothetical protein